MCICILYYYLFIGGNMIDKNKKCRMCGGCCRVIPIAFNMEEIKKMYDKIDKNNYDEYEYDVIFIYENWTELNYIDIWRIYPDKSIYNDNYFKCNKFNIFNNKCMVHKDKPRVCREYPYEKMDKSSLIYEGCIYNEE